MQHDAADRHSNKIQASYTLEGTVLENVDNIKYLGKTITNDLKWNTHISNICNKAEKHVTIQQQQWRMLGSNRAIPVRLSLIFSLILVKSV